MSDRQRQPGSGKFVSQTATQTRVDEHRAATVQELADGTTLLSTAPEVENLPDGSQIITAARAPGAADEAEAASIEPRIFTLPSDPNVTIAGTLFKLGPGKWKKTPRRYIRFVNGHAAATTEQEVERILTAYPTTGKNRRLWEEPAPLLRAEEAAKRGLEPPYLFENAKGQVLFWTYHRDAYEAFQRVYVRHAASA